LRSILSVMPVVFAMSRVNAFFEEDLRACSPRACSC
jgi:hypothetical protein